MVALITAEEEYNKDPKLRPADIAQLREWLLKQPHLPQDISEEFLIATLHSSDYSVELAKQLLDTNITSRTLYTELFANRDPLNKDNQAAWNFVDIWVSPQVTREKYRVYYGGLNNFDVELFDFPSMLHLFANTIDTLVAEQGVCPGYVIVLDCRGVTLSHLAKANINFIRNVLHYIQEGICIKIKAIHVIYVSPVIDKIMFVVKPFLKKELLDMLYFHTGEMEEFYKAVPRNILPEEIGGTMGHKEKLLEASRSRVERLREFLINQEEKLKIEESKRTEKKTDKYSVAGTFRKLELD